MVGRVSGDDLNFLLGLIESSRSSSIQSDHAIAATDAVAVQRAGTRSWVVDGVGNWIETAYLRCGDDEEFASASLPVDSDGLWNRNHNFWVDRLKADTGRTWTEQQYFDAAVIVNAAEYERVSFGRIADALISNLAGANDDTTGDGTPLHFGDDLPTESLISLDRTSIPAVTLNGAEDEAAESAARAIEDRGPANGRPYDIGLANLYRGAPAAITAFSLVRADLFARSADAALRPMESWSGAGSASDAVSANGQARNADENADAVNAAAGTAVDDAGELARGGQTSSGTGSAAVGSEVAQLRGATALELLQGTALFDDISAVTAETIKDRTQGGSSQALSTSSSTSGADLGASGSILIGTAGDDVITGTAGDDVIYGRDGNDVIFGDSAADGGETDPGLLAMSSGELRANLQRQAESGDQAETVTETPSEAPVSTVTSALSIQESPAVETIDANPPAADLVPVANPESPAQDVAAVVEAPISAQHSPPAPNVDTSVSGYGGDDYVYGQGGNDTIYGGGGEDLLDGGSGDDMLFGGSDKDRLIGSSGSDLLDGGKDADVLSGGTGEDILLGGSGSDSLDGGSDADILLGGSGSDTLRGGTGDDACDGETNNDEIYGEAGDDLLIGGDGDDLLDGGLGSDAIYAGSGNDWLLGGDGDDQMSGGYDDDRLEGGSGNDSLDGGSGSDWLDGGAGDDILVASLGDDMFIVSLGNDTIALFAGFGNDRVEGFDNSWKASGSGSDRIDISSYGFTLEAFGRDIFFEDVSDGTTITIGGDSLRLVGVSASTIDFTDFLLS